MNKLLLSFLITVAIAIGIALFIGLICLTTISPVIGGSISLVLIFLLFWNLVYTIIKA
jgi:hypothetical protein